MSAARRHRPLVCALALAALATVPLLATAVRLVPGWVPQGDDATIVLRGDDLLTADTPLLGMPSTVGDAVDAPVHHPGPLESQTIGLVAAVVDDPRVAVVVVTLVNLLSVLVVLHWAHRLGGTTLLALAGVVTAAVLWSLRGPILVTPFNPYVAVLAFLACMASLIAATERHRWAVTAAMLSGSWAAQAHLTTTGPVVAATAAAGALGAIHWIGDRRADRPSATGPERRRLLVGAGALAACWAFPLIDVVTNEGGNVRTVLRASGSLEDETLGTGRAVDVLVQALSVRPVWAQAGAGSPDLLATPSGLERLVVGVLLLGAVAVGWRCRQRRPAATSAVVVALGALAVGGALTARIPGAFFNATALHNYLWLWPVSAVLWVAVVAAVAHLAAERLPRPVPRLVAVLPAILVAAVLAATSVGAPHRPAETALPRYVRSLAPQVVDGLDPAGQYLLDLDADIATYGIGTGLLRHLERAGYDVKVPERFARSFGDHRVDDGDGRSVLVVRRGRAVPEPPAADAVQVATYTPPADRVRERDDVEQALIDALGERGGLSVTSRGRIAPDEVADWVRSGGLLEALEFRLLDATAADLPDARRLRSLTQRPLDHVVVHLLRACTTDGGAEGCGG